MKKTHVAIVKTSRKPKEEQIKAGVRKAVELIDEKACSGCRGELLASLRDMQVTGKMDAARGWTIVAGPVEYLPDVNREKLLLIGACTSKYKDRGHFLNGCPPPGWDMVAALMGEELVAWH
jgi:hypothetical protein